MTTEPTPAPKTENEDVVVQLRSRSQSSTTSEDDQRAKIITRLTEENPATVAEIIQMWLNEGKKS
jgi:flagellar biosynthesis/type III secretory pathway M-ring protein FliF/YscJ